MEVLENDPESIITICLKSNYVESNINYNVTSRWTSKDLGQTRTAITLHYFTSKKKYRKTK